MAAPFLVTATVAVVAVMVAAPRFHAVLSARRFDEGTDVRPLHDGARTLRLMDMVMDRHRCAVHRYVTMMLMMHDRGPVHVAPVPVHVMVDEARR